MPIKATKTIKQALSYKLQHESWFEQTKVLFNRVVAFYFEVIQAHQGILELSGRDALTALEKLTHEATVLVFEHLGHFQPEKGKYSV